ncbi:MAG: tRNA 4-thiouridine(8) synthase ThiI [Clostridiales bacterium]|jgi:thiamine biosynthesis protein ThiI|nr:tRNA 4-thiouridine(8) synthase ThiI [Clostridiales bacterium]
MEKCILIRYGEIFLKGGNRSYFESLLKKNIKESLRGIKHSFGVSQARYYIAGYDENFEGEILNRLKKVFGIHSLSVCYKLKTDLENIGDFLCRTFDKTGKFRVTVNRADKRIGESSTEIAGRLGTKLLENSDGLTVSLKDFDHEINVDVRENGFTYVFYDKIRGAGGLPVGCSGHGLLLLSGGIDSPVAGYMAARRGMKISAVHFYSFPYTSIQAKEKVLDLAKKLKLYTAEMTVHFVMFTAIQEAIYDKCPNEYLITVMRRMMMRIADGLCGKYRFDAVITGENLGQVASQTVESLTSTSRVTDRLILRPLICFDKAEIIETAKKIETYETSILPFEDCCTVFLPKNPVIRPHIKAVEEMEKTLDVDGLIAQALNGMTETVRF